MKKKKGFTLIELLAVIIILAIIALIATPIVMRVIENSKKSAAERGAENYVRAVETQALALRGKGTTLDGTYGINSNGNLCPNNATTCSAAEEIKIDMSGAKPSSGSVVITNGKVVASGANSATTSLTIGDYTATIGSNGSAVATKSGNTSTPRYYYWGSGSISNGLPSDANTDLSKITIPNNLPFYLAFDSANGKDIDAEYVCFVRNGTPYCIQGGDSGAAFESNQGILDIAFPSACSLADGGYRCNAGVLRAQAYADGNVSASGGDPYCIVYDDGYFGCHE